MVTESEQKRVYGMSIAKRKRGTCITKFKQQITFHIDCTKYIICWHNLKENIACR